MSKLSGFLISIEGIDGSGKSTLASNLYAALTASPYSLSCLLTQEPSKSHFGKAIRTLVSHPEVSLSPLSEFLLFAADRAEHFKNTVIPALNNNTIVISDRLSDSSLAYQGYGRGVDLHFIDEVNKNCMNNITPDYTIYLRIDIEAALQRVHHRKEPLTSFEQETNHFWNNVINGFDTLFKTKKNSITLNASQSETTLVEETLTHLLPLLSSR